MLFLLYINDSPDYIQYGSKVNLFTDDSISYRTLSSIEDFTKLQNDLNCLQNGKMTGWCPFIQQSVKQSTLPTEKAPTTIWLYNPRSNFRNSRLDQVPRYQPPQIPKLETPYRLHNQASK